MSPPPTIVVLGQSAHSLIPILSAPLPVGKLERETSNFPTGRGAEGLGTRLECTREQWKEQVSIIKETCMEDDL